MQKKKQFIAIGEAILLCMGVCACAKQEDFDAKTYVQSALDACYHGEFTDYADMLGISEEDAKKQMEEDFDEQIRQQFDASDPITEEGIAAYAEKMKEIKALAKYEVQDVEKAEDGSYTVSVKVEPSDVFQTLEESSVAVSSEKIQQGLDENDPVVFASVLTESIQKSIDQNSYGDPVIVKVTVKKDYVGSYGLDESEMNKLEAAMFPNE